VTRGYLTGNRISQLFHDDWVRELLGITDGQYAEANRAIAGANDVLNQFEWKTSDPDEKKRLNEAIPVADRRTADALFGILTPEQRARWDELTAERPVPPTPDLSPPTTEEAPIDLSSCPTRSGS